MFLNESGEIILTIEDMELNLLSDKFELLQVGYMQAECNEERMVDFEDAIRILIEDNYMPGFRVIPSRYSQDSLRLYGTILKVRLRTMWNREFPRGRAS